MGAKLPASGGIVQVLSTTGKSAKAEAPQLYKKDKGGKQSSKGGKDRDGRPGKKFKK